MNCKDRTLLEKYQNLKIYIEGTIYKLQIELNLLDKIKFTYDNSELTNAFINDMIYSKSLEHTKYRTKRDNFVKQINDLLEKGDE